MKSRGQISAGWSFTAGTFFGAFAVFAVPAALHSSRAGAGTSVDRRPVAAESVGAARAPEVYNLELAPAASRRAKTGAADGRLEGHSELDLQLD